MYTNLFSTSTLDLNNFITTTAGCVLTLSRNVVVISHSYPNNSLLKLRFSVNHFSSIIDYIIIVFYLIVLFDLHLQFRRPGTSAPAFLIFGNIRILNTSECREWNVWWRILIKHFYNAINYNQH